MTTKDSPFMEKYLTPIAVLLGAIIIALAFAFGTGESRPATEQGGEAVVDIREVKADASPSVGAVTAPVTIAVWYDYQCGHCQNYEKGTLSQVYDEYVADGKVRIVYKDFQFFGEESDRLSAYGRAVYESNPGAFYAWMNAAMAAQADKAFGTEASIDALLATIPGVDAARVKALVAEKGAEYAAAAAADREEGGSFGITGTPGTIVGTTLVPGAVGYAQLQALIDAELGS